MPRMIKEYHDGIVGQNEKRSYHGPLARLIEGDVYKTPVNVSSPGLLKASQPTIAQQTNTLIFYDDFYDRR